MAVGDDLHIYTPIHGLEIIIEVIRVCIFSLDANFIDKNDEANKELPLLLKVFLKYSVLDLKIFLAIIFL